jgi:hypothetical protein
MNKLTLLLTALFTIAFMNLSAQITFQKTFGENGSDYGHAVQQTSDGGFIIVGITLGFGTSNVDVYLIKTNDRGDTLWTKTFGETEWDFAYSVQQTSDGGYIIVGAILSLSVGDYDVLLIKTDSSGNILWTKIFGGTGDDSGSSVQQTSDGGFIIVGTTSNFGSGDKDVYLIKTDNNGGIIWTNTFRRLMWNSGNSVQQTSDGGYIIVGDTKDPFSESYVYLIKTDSSGDSLWTKTFGGTDDDSGGSVQQTSDGGYIITGVTKSFGAGYEDAYLIKTDANGDSLWTKTFGGTNSESGSSVQQTSDGGYIFTGRTISFGAGGSDVYLVKTDGSGNTLWTKTFGGAGNDKGNSVQQTSDGGYIIVGDTESFGPGDLDVYLIKTDANGDIATGIAAQANSVLSVKSYPNPTGNNLNISATLQGNEVLQYQMSNTLGTIVASNTATTNDFSIDVSALPAGIYFIHLQSGNAKTVQRFVKE